MGGYRGEGAPGRDSSTSRLSAVATLCRSPLSQDFVDVTEDPFEAVVDFLVRVAEHAPTLCGHPSITSVIALGIVGVPVYLDHNLELDAGEISDESPDRMLPSELVPAESSRSELIPHEALVWCLVRPHGARSVALEPGERRHLAINTATRPLAQGP